ncbi:hypothetical protein LTR66_008884 [Elasticomyces elasticus]|nr:hypothetical protein LTR66_008884 [Elasticomyces elasticus]
MAENGNQRQNIFNKPEQSFAQKGQPFSNQYPLRGPGQMYASSMPHQHPGESNMAALTNALSGMNMQNPTFAAQAKHAIMANSQNGYGGVPLGPSMPAAIWPNGQVMFPNHQPPQNGPSQYNGFQQSPGMYTPVAAQYVHGNFQGYAQHHDNSPLSQNWTPNQSTITGEMPALITPRRDSISSNENDAPGTPYGAYGGYQQGLTVINRSPSGVFTHSTPSPSQMFGPYGMPLVKVPEQSNVSPRVHLLVARNPPIPRAIPAPSSPLKPLDRAMENPRGETNVYIRGLLPETTDEMLENWGTRFGDIKSSKSIIDHSTGLCKGFGFVRYHNYKDAEDCIRGFHYLGYEVSFARESFYSKLKTFADDHNTNLYVSNLPKEMNEHELGSIFTPHKVCSARILRDKNGTGRGVGFARFETREVCDDVIRDFNNTPIKAGSEEHIIQIRFADTQEQKMLKQHTAAARQFRSAEYEYATAAHKQNLLYGTGRQTQYASQGNENVNEFEAYLGSAPGVPIQGQRWTQSALRQGPSRAPLAGLPYAAADSQPFAQTNVAPTAETSTHNSSSTDSTSGPAIAHGDNNSTESGVPVIKTE